MAVLFKITDGLRINPRYIPAPIGFYLELYTRVSIEGCIRPLLVFYLAPINVSIRPLSGSIQQCIGVITKISNRLLSNSYPDFFSGLYPASVRVLCGWCVLFYPFLNGTLSGPRNMSIRFLSESFTDFHSGLYPVSIRVFYRWCFLSYPILSRT